MNNDNKEQEFTKLVQQYKSTVYAVFYMFADNRTELEQLRSG